MEFSFSSGNYYDTEDSFSEDSLNPTFSEDTISCENTTFQEEITFNVDFSVQLLLTSECRGGMGNERTTLSREGQIQDNPEPAFVQSSAPPSDDHDNMLAGEDYIVQSLLNSLHNYLQNLNGEGNQTGDNENQTGGNENKRDDDENEKNEQIPENDKVDESVFPEPSDGRDFQLGSSSLPHTAQISHREHDTCQDWPKYKPLENKDVQFLEITPMLKGQNLKVRDATQENKGEAQQGCQAAQYRALMP
ncbi:PREDICTED: uncharacterized protein C12orf71 homolog [Chinchilla lanigera]|uniref:uncharacterized protein C12orf71 homolog n=1 Tax=Chinchilla lanigera TaxID=34839 RepID=UPI00038F0877|nr:PREDICTED: uncharacterized protein C12orf71 homolog [Chinchilla lanigera]